MFAQALPAAQRTPQRELSCSICRSTNKQYASNLPLGTCDVNPGQVLAANLCWSFLHPGDVCAACHALLLDSLCPRKLC